MIALASDHGGYDLKRQIIAWLEEKGIGYQDFGCYQRPWPRGNVRKAW